MVPKLMSAKEVAQTLLEVGFSQSEIARQAGLSKVTVHRIVNGKGKPSGKAVMKLRRFLSLCVCVDDAVREAVADPRTCVRGCQQGGRFND